MSALGPRPAGLPIAPQHAPARRHLPLAAASRPIDSRWMPVYCVWELTLRCDQACRHCGSRAGRARPDELATAEVLDVVSQLRDLGVGEVTLIGGEVYLRDDWTTIVRAVRDAGMECTMTTGGRGFTPERARAGKDAGLRSVSVSVDGGEATHDGLRGVHGSWRSANEALTNLRAAGVPVSVNTQFDRANLHDVPDMFEALLSKGIHSWQVQLTIAMGRAADEPEMLLQPFQMLELMPMLARTARRAAEAKVRVWPGDNIGYFGPYESLLRGTFPRGHLASCGAGRSTIGIESNGGVKGCSSLPSGDYVGSNVRDHRLRDIWERAGALRFTRDRTVNDLWGFCRTCYYADTCRAGCTTTSHTLLGRPGNNPMCHHRALEFLREGKRERLVRCAEPGGRPFDYGRYDVIVEDWPAEQLERARAVAASGEGWITSASDPSANGSMGVGCEASVSSTE